MKVRRVSKPDELLPILESIDSQQEKVFLLFFGSEDPATQQSWCPDCVIADPRIRKQLLTVPDSVLLECPVSYLEIFEHIVHFNHLYKRLVWKVNGDRTRNIFTRRTRNSRSNAFPLWYAGSLGDPSGNWWKMNVWMIPNFMDYWIKLIWNEKSLNLFLYFKCSCRDSPRYSSIKRMTCRVHFSTCSSSSSNNSAKNGIVSGRYTKKSSPILL